jgi:hypothetical protein
MPAAPAGIGPPARIEKRNDEAMTSLQIDQTVTDFDTWRRSFKCGWTLCAAKRRGLRRYRMVRSRQDPNHVKVVLEFERLSQAEMIRAALTDLSQVDKVFPAVVGALEMRIVEADGR